MIAALQLAPPEDDFPTKEPPTKRANAPFEILFDFLADDDEPTVRIERADITEVRPALQPSKPEPLSEIVGRVLEKLRKDHDE